MKKYLIFKPGQMMFLALIVLTVILILAASLFGLTSRFIAFFSKTIMNEQATQLAEGGMDYAVQKLNDTAGSYLSLPENTETRTLSTGDMVIKIDSKSESVKTVTSTGYVPNKTSPKAVRAVKADVYISSQQVSFRYAVQVGNGGISMSQSSSIAGVGGTNATVYTNGSVTAVNTPTIYGDLYTVGTVTGPLTVTGTTNTGQPSLPLPTIDETEWKDKADDNITNCSTTCTISSNTSIGPRKYVGNLTISNNAIVTVNGPVWVTGNFTMTQGGTTLKLNDSFGSNGTAIIVDGKVDLSQGGQFQPTNSDPKGFLLVISHSTAADALTISQSGSAAIFYALNGGAMLSQSAQVTSVYANSLNLSQTANLEYEQGLASANFSSGPGGSWQIKKGTYIAIKPSPIPENNALIAVYDSAYKAPTCAESGGISCDSENNLNGRDNVAGIVEINTPNTTDSCLDDTDINQSRIDRILVSTQDGLPFKVGTSTKIETWGFFEPPDAGSEGLVDFYYKNSTTTPPYWQHIGTSIIMDPDADPGPFHFTSSTFSLTGNAGLHTVRAQYRDHNAGAQSCSRMWDWPYTDESDDLVFNVGS